MVRRDRHNIRIAGAVSARAPAGSVSVTDLQIAYLPPERLRSSPNNARTHSKKQLKQIAGSIERRRRGGWSGVEDAAERLQLNAQPIPAMSHDLPLNRRHRGHGETGEPK